MINFVGCNPYGAYFDKVLPYFDVKNIKEVYNANKSMLIQNKIDEMFENIHLKHEKHFRLFGNKFADD